MKKAVIIFLVFVFAGALASETLPLRAQTVNELKQKIDERSSTIKQLEQEIQQYQQELDKTSAQAKTLQSAVNTLDLNSKKLSTDVKVTETKIDSTNLEIKQLANQISDKESRMQNDRQAISSALNKIYQSEQEPLFEALLTYNNLASYWAESDNLGQFQSKVQDRLAELQGIKVSLEGDKTQSETKKGNLMSLKGQLLDQKTVIEVNKSQKSQLLAETKNKESNYKQIISDKKAKKDAFEKELYQFESQLKIAIDPKSIPLGKTGVLAWPLDSHRITQYFGNTEFAQAHTALYNGSGHNGIDLAASVGTPVKAALGGVVKGSGNTDTVCPGASYGKWVLLEHSNGLSTLYAHLSIIKVDAGQKVAIGDVVGYSGMTGYSTGPHLHFTVYATQGVKIMNKQSQACGGTYTMPIADLRAYLDPMQYL